MVSVWYDCVENYMKSFLFFGGFLMLVLLLIDRSYTYLDLFVIDIYFGVDVITKNSRFLFPCYFKT